MSVPMCVAFWAIDCFLLYSAFNIYKLIDLVNAGG